MSVHPSRITVALDAAGLYGPQVDRDLGGEEPMVDRWETGELAPTAGQVIRLAAMTGFPVGWFYRGPVEPIRRGWICQRSGKGRGCRRI